MKALLVIAMSCFALMGCHQHEHHEGEEHHAGETHSHGADAKSFSGATHQEGKGITLLPETKERLNLKLTEVREEKLPEEILFTARVFASEAKGRFDASGILPAEQARHLKEGSPVTVHLPGGAPLNGIVARTSMPLSTNETELIVRFSSPEPVPLGSFLRATVSLAPDEPVMTIPRNALIKGTTESFVYVQNEDAYLRTVVKPGRETSDAVEIKDGLLEGDFVVSHAAMDLWLVELRAVKGGQGCCPAPPVKGKK